MRQNEEKTSKDGQRFALLIAGLGVFWLGKNMLGAYLQWSNRTHALFDLAVLAGFGLVLWNVIKLWRARQSDRG